MTIEEIINAWHIEAKADIHCLSTTVIQITSDKIRIITDRPGLYIGHHGSIVFKYTQIIKDNGFTQNIEFIDTGSGQQVKFLYD